MKNWIKTFLQRMDQALAPYRETAAFLEEEGMNPDTLRLMFNVGGEQFSPVVMDIAVFVMEDGSQLLQLYTLISSRVEEASVPELLKMINAKNIMSPIGAFGYAPEQRELAHRYTMLVEEPSDMDRFVNIVVRTIDRALGYMIACYGELSGIVEMEM